MASNLIIGRIGVSQPVGRVVGEQQEASDAGVIGSIRQVEAEVVVAPNRVVGSVDRKDAKVAIRITKVVRTRRRPVATPRIGSCRCVGPVRGKIKIVGVSAIGQGYTAVLSC